MHKNKKTTAHESETTRTTERTNERPIENGKKKRGSGGASHLAISVVLRDRHQGRQEDRAEGVSPVRVQLRDARADQPAAVEVQPPGVEGAGAASIAPDRRHEDATRRRRDGNGGGRDVRRCRRLGDGIEEADGDAVGRQPGLAAAAAAALLSSSLLSVSYPLPWPEDGGTVDLALFLRCIVTCCNYYLLFADYAPLVRLVESPHYTPSAPPPPKNGFLLFAKGFLSVVSRIVFSDLSPIAK